MDKRIKPYQEIYVNCYLNSFISVLSSINTSYQQLLYINNYVYNSYCNPQTNTQSLRIRYDLDIYLEAFNKLFGYFPNCKTLQDFLYGDISFGTLLEAKSPNDMMRDLKNLLKDEGVIAFLAQDLFYLIQSNEMYYHKKHLMHYSMFVDYDEEMHCFMVFEMGARGYNCYQVPEENVLQSFSHATNPPKCFYIKTPQKLDDYTLKTTNFKNYVPEIITSIDSIQFTDALWKIPASADDHSSYIEGVSKIVNRQEANKRLLESLSFQCSEDSHYFSSLCTELKKGWEWIKNILIRAQFLGDKAKTEPCLRKSRILLNSEKVMWNKFLNCEVLK
ncbi:MAG: hypothetical protein HFH11_10260 [Dorea sp.]|jgi:hypothetical protein|nr:hypothetical protein [Clostridiales bacterium]MCI9271513.1 hypothetical protein [Dorea sp.]